MSTKKKAAAPAKKSAKKTVSAKKKSAKKAQEEKVETVNEEVVKAGEQAKPGLVIPRSHAGENIHEQNPDLHQAILREANLEDRVLPETVTGEKALKILNQPQPKPVKL